MNVVSRDEVKGIYYCQINVPSVICNFFKALSLENYISELKYKKEALILPVQIANRVNRNEIRRIKEKSIKERAGLPDFLKNRSKEENAIVALTSGMYDAISKQIKKHEKKGATWEDVILVGIYRDVSRNMRTLWPAMLKKIEYDCATGKSGEAPAKEAREKSQLEILNSLGRRKREMLKQVEELESPRGKNKTLQEKHDYYLDSSVYISALEHAEPSSSHLLMSMQYMNKDSRVLTPNRVCRELYEYIKSKHGDEAGELALKYVRNMTGNTPIKIEKTMKGESIARIKAHYHLDGGEAVHLALAIQSGAEFLITLDPGLYYEAMAQIRKEAGAQMRKELGKENPYPIRIYHPKDFCGTYLENSTKDEARF